MANEQYRSSTGFDTGLESGLDFSYMYDDIERIRERESEEEKTQQNKLSLAGLMAILAGIGMSLVAFGQSLIPTSMAEFLGPLMGIVGFAALGYGLYKTVKLAFRKKELNFPTLNVYRKRKPKTPEELAAEQAREAERKARRRSGPRRRERPSVAVPRGTYRQASGPRKLRRSQRARIFTGLAGGIAEYAGVNPWLIRILFIMLTSASGGLALFLYLFLSIAIPPDYDQDYFNNGGRNINVQ